MDKQNRGCLIFLAGLVIVIWWALYGSGGLMDCWIGEYCILVMVPALLGLILIAAGAIAYLRK